MLSCAAEPSPPRSSKRLNSSEPQPPQPHLAAQKTEERASQTHTKPKQRSPLSPREVKCATSAESTTTHRTPSRWNSDTEAEPGTPSQAHTRSAS
nr:MAG TPA: hypothetical protein [Caudoviricetes sp.]